MTFFDICLFTLSLNVSGLERKGAHDYLAALYATIYNTINTFWYIFQAIILLVLVSLLFVLEQNPGTLVLLVSRSLLPDLFLVLSLFDNCCVRHVEMFSFGRSGILYEAKISLNLFVMKPSSLWLWLLHVSELCINTRSTVKWKKRLLYRYNYSVVLHWYGVFFCTNLATTVCMIWICHCAWLLKFFPFFFAWFLN